MQIHFGCVQTVKVGMLPNGKILPSCERWTIIPKLLCHGQYPPAIASGNFDNQWSLMFYRVLSNNTLTEEIILPLSHIKPV
jgi:hypothetical protein